MIAVAWLLVVYLVGAYFFLPLLWIGYTRWHPALKGCLTITQTADGHPGDPLNVGLIGREAEIRQLLQQAGWFPADPLGLRSDLKIAADTLLERSYVEAPVSNLYLFGRKEDLAFEKPVGKDPRQRHHVRFWKSSELDQQQRPLWFGAVTFDRSVGLSHTTGQITHHIDADIDAERDRLFEDLMRTGKLQQRQVIDRFQAQRQGHNGGGDRWFTDGRFFFGVVPPDGDASP